MNTISSNTRKTDSKPLFPRVNILLLIAACILIIVGYLLMSGPGSTEKAFNLDIFSFRRIVVAPAVCLVGYLLVVAGILWRK